MNHRPRLGKWSGPDDNSRTFQTDYFIPSDLQVDFGKVKEVLSKTLTEERLLRFAFVASTRTRSIMPVFESTHHCHNISAVLRTADAFGFQDASFVYHQPEMKFKVNDSVERGSSTWLFARRTTSISLCAHALKRSGYLIFLVSLPSFARTSIYYKGELPSFAAQDLGQQSFSNFVGQKRIALVSGNEKFGLSENWAEFADGYMHVNMSGFVESLNVSVCAGILLHALRTQWLPKTTSHLLSPDEQNLLVEHWVARSCQNARAIIERENSQLQPWFDFVRSGKFYAPFD